MLCSDFSKLSTRISSAAKALIVSSCLLAMVGCADVLTHGDDARHEGIKLYNTSHYPEAAGAFNNAVRENARDFHSYYYLGRSHEAIGQFDQAKTAYQTALGVIDMTMEGRADPEFRARVIDSLAGTIAKSDHRDAETDVAESAARAKPSGWNSLLVAKIFTYRGDPDSAIQAYESGLTLDPNNGILAKQYGLYLLQTGQNQRAEAPLRRAYQLTNGDAEVAAALTRVGVVPGPGIKQESALVGPIIPKGPIPNLDVKKLTGQDEPGGVSAIDPK